MKPRALRLSLLVLSVLLPAVLASARGVGAEEEASYTKGYDVGAFLATAPEPRATWLGIPLPVDAVSPHEEQEEEPPAFVGRDLLLELVQSAMSLGGEAEAASAELSGTRLVITGSRGAHAAARTMLEDLWREASRRVRLRAHRVRWGASALRRLKGEGLLDALDRGRLGSEELRALLLASGTDGCEVTSVGTLVRPGHRTTLGRIESTSFVRDYEVEIAASSRVGDPQVETLDAGFLVEVRPFPLQDGSVFLETFAQTASFDRPVRRLSLEVEPFGSLDMPRCTVLRVATALRLAPGEAAAFVARGTSETHALEAIVLEASLEGDDAAPTSGLARYDVGALTATPSRWQFANSEFTRPHMGMLQSPWLLAWDLQDAAIEAEPLHDSLLGHFGEDAWADVGTWMTYDGGALFASNRPEVLQAVGRLLAQKEEQLASRRVQLTVRERLEDGVAQERAHALLDVPLGRPVCWQAGVEQAYLADWEVEVAQEMRSGDPQVSTVFGGLAAELRLDPSPAASVHALRLRLAWSGVEAGIESRQTHNECTGVVETPRVERYDTTQDLLVEPGKALVLPLAGYGPGHVLELEVRLVP